MWDSQTSNGSAVGLYEETHDEKEWDILLSGVNEKEDNVKITPKNSKQYSYKYEGVDIKFPYKAYLSQQQMMEKLIQGARYGQNCLLESPTGTGKTAALLCGLLAFVRWCAKNNEFGHEIAARYVEATGGCSCGLVTDPENTTVKVVKSRFGQKFRLEAHTSTPLFQTQEQGTQEKQKSENARQGSPNKLQKVDTETSSTKSKPAVQVKNMNELCMYCIKKHFKEYGPPKIYYATRTHSQIAQVLKQLKNTHYAGAKITILSSRQVTCINSKLKGEVFQKGQQEKGNGDNSGPSEDSHRSLDEMCMTLKKNYLFNRKQENLDALLDTQRKKKFLPKEECRYFAESPRILSEFKGLQRKGAWDIEDLVKHGKECGKCPFYGSQLLHEEAEIVFCPYNYIIYPGIRDNAKVQLVNSIIVFDEAHNIEDICRSAASFCVDHDNLDIHARRAFDIHLKPNAIIPPSKCEAVQHFSDVLLRLSTWILNNGNRIKIAHANSQPYMSFFNMEIVCLFKNIGFGPETLDTHENMFNILKPNDEFKNDDDKVKDLNSTMLEEPFFQVASEGLFFVHELLSVLKLIFENGMRRLRDYKVVLVNTEKLSSNLSTDNQHQCKYMLDIICLNPAVSFETIKNAARSIIVASGTLSPMISFSSELETPFSITLSADHVVNRSQVWAGVVKSGPKSELRLTKEFQGHPEIQDEIGNVILQVCEVIPHGVLVFLPSYGFMNILKARWSSYPKTNPLFNQIRKFKIVYFEESKNKEMFKKDMIDYMENIKAPSSSHNGCILFAVFRGKVSEGIDFSDNQARAVGIPYSSCYSYDVESKKTYNDNKLKPSFHSAQLTQQTPNDTNKVLSGSEWYKVQAFRAINQGFGRCIRHKDDWGAIIMIDSRLTENKNQEYLSGWVQQHMRPFKDFKTAKGSLLAFVDKQLKIEDEMQSLSEYDDDDNSALTQLCEIEEAKYAVTQRSSKTASIASCSKSKPTVPIFDGDSSAYSIEDFDDDGNDHIFNDFNIQAAIENASTLHEQTTLLVDTESQSDSDVSYHSDSSSHLNTTQGEADISVDMILGTP